jgi:hypothetical protein
MEPSIFRSEPEMIFFRSIFFRSIVGPAREKLPTSYESTIRVLKYK